MATVIDNLLLNAIKHSPKDSRIEVSLMERKNRVQLDVIDSGPGIDPQDKLCGYLSLFIKEATHSRALCQELALDWRSLIDICYCIMDRSV